MPARRLAVVVAVIVVTLLYPRHTGAEVPKPVIAAALESPLHLRSSSNVVTDGGSLLRLPPGYFLDEPLWAKLDVDVTRLQTAETRLAAENKSLRASADGWRPGWVTLTMAVATGFVGGWYASFYVTR